VGYFLDDKISTNTLAPIDVDPTIHTVKLGVNYKF
jgi:opacity protein-like surface antigen